MATQPDQEGLRQALAGVLEPGSGRDVLTLGLVREARCQDGVVQVDFLLPAQLDSDDLRGQLTRQCETRLGQVPGVSAVKLAFAVAQQPGTPAMRDVRHIIAVGAGKGGVGKSTVALLLAMGLQRRGQKVGLLDADVYGPSLPKLTGTENAQPTADSEGRLVPPLRGGMPIMSMGYLVSPDQAVVWRGPMAQKYVKEFLDRGLWGELDCLVVDLPPGTGDIPLTLAQSIPLTGAVVVCTPQDVALLDAVKAIRMYEKLGVETLGMIENMSYYTCPQCGHRDDLFGHGGVQKAAEELGVPLLGQIPLHGLVRRIGDEGRPEDYFREPPAHVTDAIERVVGALDEQIAARGKQQRPLPQLNISG